jgi:hypothetical protein
MPVETKSVPVSPPSIPNAWQSFPGPFISSRSEADRRRERISSSPKTGRAARINTAPTVSESWATTFSIQWLPYTKYT